MTQWFWIISWLFLEQEQKQEQEQGNKLAILTKSLGPVCVAVGILLFVFYSPAAR